MQQAHHLLQQELKSAGKSLVHYMTGAKVIPMQQAHHPLQQELKSAGESLVHYMTGAAEAHNAAIAARKLADAAQVCSLIETPPIGKNEAERDLARAAILHHDPNFLAADEHATNAEAAARTANAYAEAARYWAKALIACANLEAAHLNSLTQ